jgi:hypothetical protein
MHLGGDQNIQFKVEKKRPFMRLMVCYEYLTLKFAKFEMGGLWNIIQHKTAVETD